MHSKSGFEITKLQNENPKPQNAGKELLKKGYVPLPVEREEQIGEKHQYEYRSRPFSKMDS